MYKKNIKILRKRLFARENERNFVLNKNLQL